jgi:hypothetical protein
MLQHHIASRITISSTGKVFCFLMISILLAICGCDKGPEYRLLTSESYEYSDTSYTYSIDLENIDLELYRLSVKRFYNDSLITAPSIFLTYDLFQFFVGDVDNDGTKNICIGIIKDCEFDPNIAKRLFVYSIDNGYIVPRWLGTYLGNRLIDFRLIYIDNMCYIRSLEVDDNGIYFIGTYHFIGFGPESYSYIEGGKYYENAYKLYSQD